jgi:hypothetical protein
MVNRGITLSPIPHLTTRPACCLALKGDSKFTTAHRRAVLLEVKRLGFKKVRWERRKKGLDRDVATELT